MNPLVHFFRSLLLLGPAKLIFSPRVWRQLARPFLVMKRSNLGTVPLQEAKSILVVKLDRLGDVILSTGFLRELRLNAPHAEITLIVREGLEEIFRECPYVDVTLPFECTERWLALYREKHIRATLKEHFRFLLFWVRHLSRQRYDWAIVARSDADYYGAILLTFLSGAVQRLGFSPRDWHNASRTDSGLETLFTHVVRERPDSHEAVKVLRLLTEVGCTISDDSLELWPSEDDRQHVDRLLGNRGHSRDELPVALAIGAGNARRVWPIERFSEVAEWLIEECRRRVLIVGAKEEHGIGEKISLRLGAHAENFCGRLSLGQLASAIERCSLCITNDSGPLHVASAMGTPVIEISCHARNAPADHPFSPVRFGPWKVPHVVLRPWSSRPPCAGVCVAEEPHCILEVTPAMVRTAAKKLLESERQTALES